MLSLRSVRGVGPAYAWLCLVQTVALGGNALTAFAMGVWIFQTEGRALAFAMLEVVSTLPLLLVLPWAGSVADRCDRRRVVLAAGAVAALATLALAVVLARGTLAVWHLYAYGFVTAVAGAFQRPAFAALAAALLPRTHISQGSGLMNLSQDAVGLLAPLSAGVLMSQLGLAGIVALDLLLLGAAALMFVRMLPALSAAAMPAREGGGRGWARMAARDFLDTLASFDRQPLLRSLLGYAVLQGALVSLVAMLIAPLVLSRFDSTQLGLVMTLGGLGGVAGSGLLIVSGQRRHLMVGLLLSDAVLSLCVLLAGLRESLLLYVACACVAFAAAAAAMGYSAALWIRKVPADRRGRVYALIGTVGLMVGPLVAGGGAYLADRVFEPALAGGGVFAGWAGAVVGTGKGRALALVFVLAGALGLALALLGLAREPFRSLDERVPDCESCEPSGTP